MLLFFCLFFSPIVHASSSITNPLEDSGNQLKVYAKVTNQQTGETNIFPVENIKENKSSSRLSVSEETDSNGETKEYEVTIEIPNDNLIQPASVESTSKTTDVTAKLSINFDRISDQIRINSVYGSWTSPSSYLTISNRVVGYTDGSTYGGHSATKYPTSNSFSYTTGWGYVYYYPQSNIGGPRAYSEAKVSISSTSSHLIELMIKL